MSFCLRPKYILQIVQITYIINKIPITFVLYHSFLEISILFLKFFEKEKRRRHRRFISSVMNIIKDIFNYSVENVVQRESDVAEIENHKD